MSRPEDLRLRDILAAISTIHEHLAGGEFERKTSDAVLYNLVVIGEAAARIGEEARARAPEIPWASIVGLRNLVTHEYFRVDPRRDRGHRQQLPRPARNRGHASAAGDLSLDRNGSLRRAFVTVAPGRRAVTRRRLSLD